MAKSGDLLKSSHILQRAFDIEDRPQWASQATSQTEDSQIVDLFVSPFFVSIIRSHPQLAHRLLTIWSERLPAYLASAPDSNAVQSFTIHLVVEVAPNQVDMMRDRTDPDAVAHGFGGTGDTLEESLILNILAALPDKAELADIAPDTRRRKSNQENVNAESPNSASATTATSPMQNNTLVQSQTLSLPDSKPSDIHQAPNFAATSTTGQTIALSDLRGEVVVVYFFSPWTDDMQPAVLDHLSKLSSGLDASKVKVLPVSDANSGNENVETLGQWKVKPRLEVMRTV